MTIYYPAFLYTQIELGFVTNIFQEVALLRLTPHHRMVKLMLSNIPSLELKDH